MKKKALKIGKWTAFVLMLLSGAAVLVCLLIPWIKGRLFLREMAMVNIIGGADGPTAIYTTARFSPIAGALFLFPASILAWLLLRRKTKE